MYIHQKTGWRIKVYYTSQCESLMCWQHRGCHFLNTQKVVQKCAFKGHVPCLKAKCTYTSEAPKNICRTWMDQCRDARDGKERPECGASFHSAILPHCWLLISTLFYELDFSLFKRDWTFSYQENFQHCEQLLPFIINLFFNKLNIFILNAAMQKALQGLSPSSHSFVFGRKKASCCAPFKPFVRPWLTNFLCACVP